MPVGRLTYRIELQVGDQVGGSASDVRATRAAGLRRAYLTSITIVWVFLVVLWGLGPALEPFQRVVVPALLVVLPLLVLGLASRLLPVRVVGPLMLLIIVVTVLSRLVFWRLGILPDLGSSGDSIVMVAYLAASFPIAFLVFGTRRGLQVSVAIYVAFVGLYGNAVLDALLGRATDVAAHAALSLAVTFTVLIATIWVLASRLERLAAEHARAEMLAEQAGSDPLTGIANRRRLDDELDRMIAQSRRYGQPLSVILIDLDLFKQVNDHYGHDIGDQVLIETVRRLETTVRDADLLGRWGGEEFLLLAPNTDHAAACALAERCRQAIAGAPMVTAGEVTASFGVATHVSDDDVRSLMRRADLALYTAKAEGRDRVIGMPDIEVRGIFRAAARQGRPQGDSLD